MKEAIGYLRVSTKEQGRSGLSLTAQRFDIEHFGKREGLIVTSWYQDIQTGAGKDPLTLRPGLATALKEARAARSPLIVSRLDRLSRNVHFIAGLMEHKVHFVVAAFGRDVDHFTLHIYASIAQQERKMIAERVKAATEIAKSQGRKFGLQLRSKSWQRHVSALGRAALCREADERAQAYRVYIEWALNRSRPDGRPISFSAAAKNLNERQIETPLGGRWRGHHLQRMARRLKLDHPVAYMPQKLARARVRALWKDQPYLTAPQVVAAVSAGAPRRLDLRRAYPLIRECREEAARRSQIHQKAGWSVDMRTATRIRISELWKRHPEFTAKQIIDQLGGLPRGHAREKWVQNVLHECWRVSAKVGPKRSRVGRKTLNPWRNHAFPRQSSSIVKKRHPARRPMTVTLRNRRARKPLRMSP
jgi:DNA invertase Pin-like site-specific DNA recombinase